MDYLDTAEEAAFRAKLRDWLSRTNIPSWTAVTHDVPEAQARMRRWIKALNDGGYLAITWPAEEGGQGLSPIYNVILNQEVGSAVCPPYPGTMNVFARVIATYGTPGQRERFLPPTFKGDIIWCQGFSEPGAGSDIAAMKTRAVRDGDEWIVEGQKLWTSHAVYADWCFLLARTDSAVPKHKGISAFLVNLKSPGVTVREVRIASGEPETAEVFWDKVRIPADQMLGRPGDGWKIALSTFSYERNPAEMDVISRMQHWLRGAEQLAAELGKDGDPEVRRRLADLYVRIEGLAAVCLEQMSARVSGGAISSEESSIGKMLWTQIGQEMQHLVLDMLGPLAVNTEGRDPMVNYTRSRVYSVYGGTSQIQRNILASRVLGLPRAPSAK
jgi:alkylation response protein AidB-like acyl-CoA dehydrogenase